jgi:hypothetical protein
VVGGRRRQDQGRLEQRRRMRESRESREEVGGKAGQKGTREEGKKSRTRTLTQC